MASDPKRFTPEERGAILHGAHICRERFAGEPFLDCCRDAADVLFFMLSSPPEPPELAAFLSAAMEYSRLVFGPLAITLEQSEADQSAIIQWRGELAHTYRAYIAAVEKRVATDQERGR